METQADDRTNGTSRESARRGINRASLATGVEALVENDLIDSAVGATVVSHLGQRKRQVTKRKRGQDVAAPSGMAASQTRVVPCHSCGPA